MSGGHWAAKYDMNTLPNEYIGQLDMFPRVQFRIREEWGTVKLRPYLSELISDTRTGERRGLPLPVMEVIIALSLAHEELLESIGLGISVDPASAFTPTAWVLPKNF